MRRWMFTTLLGLAGSLAVALSAWFADRNAEKPAISADVGVINAEEAGGGIQLYDAAPYTVTAHLDYEAIPTSADKQEITSRNLVITVTAPPTGDLDAVTVPVDLAVVVDTSGSMNDEGKFDEARAAMHALAGQLRPDDRLSLVTFSSLVNTPVRLGSASETGPLAATLLDNMTAGGSTYLSGGLNAGMDTLRGTVGDGHVHRVLLMTDGRANQGVIDQAGLVEIAKSLPGTSVSTIGMGLDYDEAELSAMADAGGGDYHYVGVGGRATDGKAVDLAAVFGEELRTAGSVVATGLTLTVDLGPGVTADRVISWSDAQFAGRTVTVGLGDLSAGQTRTIVIPVRISGGMSLSADGQADIAWTNVVGTLPGGARVASQTTLFVPIVPLAKVKDHEASDADAAATRALAGEAVDEARQAWNRGDSTAAKERLDWGSDYIRSKQAEGVVTGRGADTLDGSLQALKALGYASDEGEGAKAASETSRTMSR